MAQCKYRRDNRRLGHWLAEVSLVSSTALHPMTLGNMRANGVRTLDVMCGGRGLTYLKPRTAPYALSRNFILPATAVSPIGLALAMMPL